MVEFKDYYKTLGVARGASAKEIKAAYRRLARKHHPDVNPGNAAAEARFKEVNEAHDVLSDPDKRKRYDELGANWDAFRQAPPPGRGRPGAGSYRVEFGDDVGGFSDFFRTFFSGAGGGGGFGRTAGGAGLEDLFERGRAAPAAEEVPVELTLEELLSGTTRTLELHPGAAPRRIDVKIPGGLREGSRVRVPAQVVGSGRGDVFLRVHIRRHARFERHDGLPTHDAALMTQSLAFARYYEAARDACGQPKQVANWLMGEVAKRLNAEGAAIDASRVAPATLATLIGRIGDGTLSNNGARQVFDLLWSEGRSDVDAVIEAKGLKQMSDAGALEAIVVAVIAANARSVDEYRAGKDKAFNALVGQVMKASQGKANPAQAGELLKKKLAG